MKKIALFLFLFLFAMPVFAEEYEVGTFIPVNQSATVHTEKFDYNDFTFSTAPDEKGNGKLSFSSIHNNGVSKTAVSINVYLFDESKKNVGYLTYCSDKDYVTEDNRGFKLNGGESHPFVITVSNRYFVVGKEIKDVFYIVVKDDNKYCHVGGYDQYAGLTLEEIQGNALPEKESNFLLFFQNLFQNIAENLFQNSTMTFFIISIIVALIIYFTIGSILNKLHYRMYGKKTALCYIPIANVYITVRLAFGKIIAITFIIFYLISCGLIAIGFGILSLIFSGISGIAFLIDIIKLITKKYELLYLEPTVDTSEYQEAFNQETTRSPIDLSYSNRILPDGDNIDSDNRILSGDEINRDMNISTGNSDNLDDNDNSSSNDDETDLTKLFR